MADEKDLQTPAEPQAEQDVAQQDPPVEEATPDEGGQPAAEVSADASEPQEETPAEGDAPPSESAEAEAEGEAAADSEAAVDGDADADMMEMLKEVPEEDQQSNVDDINFPEASVSKAEFQQLSQPAGDAEGRNIDLLMDVNLPISIELGRTKMSISDILALGPGSVVELNKLAGEPVDLLVNQKVVARGEVVVIDENFGVRITQLMTAAERLKSLGEDA